MFFEIKPSEIPSNAFEMFPKRWALISAGDEKENNAMTVSWGGFGHLWYKDIAYVYVRPSRYTYQLIEAKDTFVITFLKDGYKEDLTYFGKNSGRNQDKTQKTNLTKTFIDDYPTFEQAEYVIICKKSYQNDIKLDEFVDKELSKVYKDDNIHRQYIGEILKVYKND